MRLLVPALVVLASLTAAFFVWQRFFSHEAKVIRLVQATLTDPESAQFRGVRRSGSASFTCGEVNAKNRMGGYVGFTPFMVAADGAVTLHPPMPVQHEGAPQFLAKFNARVDFELSYAKHCANH